MDLFGRKSKAKTKSEAAARPKIAAPTVTARPKQQIANHNQSRAATPSPSKQMPQPAVIANKEEIPAFARMLGEADGIVIRPNVRDRYVALLLSEAKKTVLLVGAQDTHKTGVPDAIKMDIVSQLRNAGYQPAFRLATASVMEIVRSRVEKEDKIGLSEREISLMEVAYDNLLEDAVNHSASDIHIEVRRDSAVIKYRVHGIISPRDEWSTEHATKFCTVAYQSLAEQDSKDVIFKPDRSQDGVIDRLISGERVRVRLATTKAYPDGFDMVMRVLRLGAADSGITLESLGYNHAQRRALAQAMRRPSGVVVIAGTTGSGKSTSLKTMLSGIVRDSRGQEKIISVEDPPEYRMEGVTQSPVSSAQAKDNRNPFAEAIKAAMRLDPDKLMVGEVRDPLTAQLLVQMTQSGHLAFTTNHAASAFGILPRFRSLSIPNDVLGSADFIVALVHQCLVGRLCECCRIPYSVHRSSNRDQESQELYLRITKYLSKDSFENVYFRNEAGCAHCHRGLSGRTVVAQVVLPTLQMKEFFAEGKDLLALRHHIESGGATLLDHGKEKIETGICSPVDIEAACGLLDSDDYADSVRSITAPAIDGACLTGMQSSLLSSSKLVRHDNVAQLKPSRDNEHSGDDQ